METLFIKNMVAVFLAHFDHTKTKAIASMLPTSRDNNMAISIFGTESVQRG